MFNMSTMSDWHRGIVNRNYFILNALLRHPNVERIVSVDFFPIGLKKTVKHYIQNILTGVKNGEMIYGDLTSACFRQAPDLYVYSTIDNNFSWKIVARELNRVKKSLNLNNIIFWSYNPMFTEFIGRLDEKLFVFDTVDNWLEHTAYSKLMSRKKLTDKYQTIAAKADLIFTVSSAMKDFFHQNDRSDHVYWVPNGVDFDHFIDPKLISQPTIIDNKKGPFIGYVGTIEGRFDLDLFAAVVKLNPEKTFIVCGPIWAAVKKAWDKKIADLPNVILTGRVDYRLLPAYLHRFDVAIMPHRQSAFVESMNPMKLYEYLAAGKPIVSTPVAGTELFPNDIKTASDANAFSDLINRALKDNSPQQVLNRQNLIKSHTWQARVDKMMSLVDSYLNEKS